MEPAACPRRTRTTAQLSSGGHYALGLVFQRVYRLPLRGALGLLRSVLDLAGLTTLPVPDPSRALPPAGKGAAARLPQVRRLPRG